MNPFYEENVRVDMGEAYLIAPIETLEHVASVYRTLGEESDDPAPWYLVAEMFENWISEKGFYPEDYEGEPDNATFEPFEEDKSDKKD